MRVSIKIIGLLILVCSLRGLNASPLLLENSLENKNLKQHLQYRFAQSGPSEIQNLVAETAKDARGWKNMSGSRLEPGIRDAPIWLRIPVSNPNGMKWDWKLNLGTIVRSHIMLFMADSQGVRKIHEVPLDSSYRSRPDPHNKYVFPIHASLEKNSWIYVYYHSPSVIQFNPSASLAENFERTRYDDWRIHGILYGILLLMFLYHLLLYFKLRDISYFYYSMVIFWQFMAFFTQDGMVHKYFPLGIADLPQRMLHISAALSLFFICQFIRAFTNLRMVFLPGDRLLLILAGLSLLVLPLYAFFPNLKTLLQIQNIHLLSGICMTIALVFYLAFFKKSRPAKYYLAASSLFLIGTLALILNALGYIPGNIFTWYGNYLGAALEAAILSVGLVERIRHLGREIRKGENRFRKYAEESRDILFTMDENFKIREINAPVHNFLGHHPEEIEGRPFLELFEPDEALGARRIAAENQGLMEAGELFTEFSAVLKDSYSQEEREFKFHLEYFHWQGKREIFGRAFPPVGETSAKFIKRERLFLYNLRNAAGIDVASRRATENLRAKLSPAQVLSIRFTLREILLRINEVENSPHHGLYLYYEFNQKFVVFRINLPYPVPVNINFPRAGHLFEQFCFRKNGKQIHMLKFFH